MEKDTRLARDLGFTGKALIHPAQIEVVEMVFRPTDAEVEYARRVVACLRGSGSGGRRVWSLLMVRWLICRWWNGRGVPCSLCLANTLLGFTVSIYKGLLLKGETAIVFDMDSFSSVSTQPM